MALALHGILAARWCLLPIAVRPILPFTHQFSAVFPLQMPRIGLVSWGTIAEEQSSLDAVWWGPGT